MVSRFTTTKIELPPTTEPFERADLIFYGLDHSGDSYEARIFLNAPKADHATPRDAAGYAGSFWIFGHGGCFGDIGHCDVPAQKDPFDLRATHALEPAIRIVTVTEAIRELVDVGDTTMTVTVVAHTPGTRSNEVLTFETVRLATYAA